MENRVKNALKFSLFFICLFGINKPTFSLSKEPLDSLKIKQDTGSIITIKNTTLGYSFYVFTNNNYGQEYPKYVHRYEFSPTVNIAGLQFNANINLSSEEFTQGRNLNRINFNFDQKSLKKALKKVNQNNKKDNILKKIDSLNNGIEEQTRNLNGLNEKLDNTEYLEKIENAKAIKNRSLNDSNYLKNNKEKINQADIVLNNYEKEVEIRSKIGGKIDTLNQLKKTYTFINNLNKESAETYILNQSGKIDRLKKKTNFLSGLASPSRFELMDVSPNWSPLILNGITLRGGVIEYNQKKFILGFTGGFVNSINWNQNIFNRNSFIYSGRIGFGNVDNNNIIFTYLNGNNNNTNEINRVKENNVIGIQVNLKITENHFLYLEKAWSNQSTGDFNQELKEVVNSTPRNVYNSANFIKYTGHLIKTKTRITSKFRTDDLFFYSLGNPSNRKDALKFSLDVKQVIYKNKINAQIITKLDKDNISESKEGTSTFQSLQGILNFKINKSNLKTEAQRIITSNTLYAQNISEINLFNVSLVKPFKILGKQVITILLINYLNTKIINNDTSNQTYLSSLNNVFNLSSKIILNANYTYSLKSGMEAGKHSNMIDLNLAYQLAKLSLNFRYSLLKIQGIETRNTVGVSNDINFTNKVTGSILINYDHIINKYLSDKNFIYMQIRVLYKF